MELTDNEKEVYSWQLFWFRFGIITKINNILVNKVSELQEQISKYRPGDKIVITVKRNKNLKDFLLNFE